MPGNPWSYVECILGDCEEIAKGLGRRDHLVEWCKRIVSHSGCLIFEDEDDIKEFAIRHTDLIDPEDI